MACAVALAEDCATTLGGDREAMVRLVRERCASCHRGPFLDLSTYPFFSDAFPTEKALLAESLRRARLQGFRRMPPVNYPPLTEAEIALLDRYVASLP